MKRVQHSQRVREPTTLFLISPANLKGKRGALLLGANARSDLARRLRAPDGAPLAEVFTFVSGLYFRGKVTYARTFGKAPPGLPASFIMTAGGGLCGLDDPVHLARLEGWQNIRVSESNPHFTAPLQRQTSELLDRHPEARFVLLGSIASNKYVAPLREVLGERLFYPERLAGLGDMARGSLLLAAAADGRELTYVPFAPSARW